MKKAPKVKLEGWHISYVISSWSKCSITDMVTHLQGCRVNINDEQLEKFAHDINRRNPDICDPANLNTFRYGEKRIITLKGDTPRKDGLK